MIRLHRLMLKAIFRQPPGNLTRYELGRRANWLRRGCRFRFFSHGESLLSADCRAGDTGIPLSVPWAVLTSL